MTKTILTQSVGSNAQTSQPTNLSNILWFKKEGGRLFILGDRCKSEAKCKCNTCLEGMGSSPSNVHGVSSATGSWEGIHICTVGYNVNHYTFNGCSCNSKLTYKIKIYLCD